MKKLFLLTALTAVTLSAAGCRWCERWWRGSYDPCPPTAIAAPVSASVVPCAPACDACAPAAISAPGYAVPHPTTN